MRSSSCIVCAVKYDSPQCGQDHIGIPSTTRRLRPLPKVRVTRLSCTPTRPQEAQRSLNEVDRDDVERPREAELDDDFCLAPIKAASSDEDFGFTRLAVSLALDDAASEDDVFDIKDREVVIFQFFGSVKGYDIVQ
jgi:hypothetical protein